MESFNLPILSNPLKTKKDLQLALMQMYNPLRNYYSDGKAELHIGYTGTRYDEVSAFLEGYARPLWGLIPYELGGGNSDVWEDCLLGLKNGTDPLHKEYWGDVRISTQRNVEMAAIAIGLLTLPEKLWYPLSDQEQDRVAAWLYQVNNMGVPSNNWCFFTVFVNLALKKYNKPYSQKLLDDSLAQIDRCYLSDGWYSDGLSEQRDYYIAFAMHYYGLVYSKIMAEDDKERSEIYKERARKFADEYIYWFSSDGSSLPFGRSLVYRFAVAAFWGALAFAGVEGIDYGVVKGIYLRNLRWWVKQPIFDSNGILTVGYAYPNLVFAEGYNSPTSPYWAFKYFIALALPDNHPFWSCEEKPLPELESQKVQRHPFMINCRDKEHIMAFTAGQNAKWDCAHSTEKYSKFVYSNKFAFSVPKSNDGIVEGAYDSTLALSEGDQYYRVRKVCEEYKVFDKYIYSNWKPWRDVSVKSWIIPLVPYHIRIHKIESARVLNCCEGGFSVFRNEREKQEKISYENGIASVSKYGISGIFDLSGKGQPMMILPEANTNLLYPRTFIPTVKSSYEAGEFWLITAVFGAEYSDNAEKLLSNPPKVSVSNGNAEIIYDNEKISLDLYKATE